MRTGIVDVMNSGERWSFATNKRVRWLIERMMMQQNVFMLHREDVRQECVIKLHQRAPEYDPALGSVLTFAKQIIRGVLTAWRRTRSMFGPRNDRDPPATRCWSRLRLHTVDRTMQDVEERVLGPNILRAIDALPERERIVVLGVAAGVEYTELGQRIGLSRQGARYVATKGLQQLQQALAD